MRLAPNSIIRADIIRAEMKCAVTVMTIHISDMSVQNIRARCLHARSECNGGFHRGENIPKTCSYFFPICARAIDKIKG